MSASVRALVIALWKADKSVESISRTVGLPAYDILRELGATH